MSDGEDAVIDVVEKTKTVVNRSTERTLPVDLLLQRAFDGIIAIDTEQRIITFNKGAEKMFGHQAQDLIGQKIDVLIPMRFVERHRQHVAAFVQSADLVRPMGGGLLTIFGRHSDGHDIPLEAIICKSIAAEPSTTTMSVFLRDISSQQRANIALRQHEAYFRALVEDSSDAKMLLNPDGSQQYISPSAEKVFGLALETLKRDVDKTYVHRDDAHVLEEAVKSVIADASQTITITYRVRQENGEWRWIEGMLKNLCHDPRVGAIVVNNRNITERVDAERALRESETRFRQLFNASPVPISLSRLSDGCYLDVNDAFSEFSGWTREQTIGKTSIELGLWLNEADRKTLTDKIRVGDTIRNVEIQLRIRSGEIRDALCSVYTMQVDDAPCLLVAITDVTDQLQAVSLMKRHNRLLNTLSAVNELLLQESDTHRLFEETCQIIVDKAGFRMAWIGIADLEQGSVTPVAEAGVERGYLSNVTIRCDDSQWGQGPTGTAIRENRTVVVVDTDTDPRYEVWREFARKYGFHSSVAVPIRQQSRVLGCLNIYSKDTNDFGPDELPLLERMSADLGFIHERLEMQEHLQQSENQLKALLDHSPALISIKDVQGNIILVNRRFEILDLPAPEQLIGKNIFDLLPQDMAEALHTSDLAVQNAGISIEGEETLQHRDGTAHTYLTIKFPVALAGETPLGICAISTDITEYKKSQKALEESENRLASFFSEAPAGLVLYDKDMRFIQVNPTLSRTGNLAPELLMGKRPSDVLPPQMASFIEDSVKAVFETGEANINEEVSGAVPSESGQVRHWMHSHFPVKDTEGRVYAVGGFVVETTVLKQAQETLKRLNQELETRVNERTKALAAANEELESFAYSVSHDLRAPLRSIDGFSRILLEDYQDVIDEEGRQHLGRIIKAIRRMGALIDALLALSRLSRQELKPQHLSSDRLSTIVREIIREIEMENVANKIDWQIEPMSPCYADLTLLRQVWFNLLHNAAKYSGHVEHPKVQIGMLNQGGENIYYVRDNGVGFDMKYADKLFGVFQRLHRQDEFEGTGIGLATVKRIMGMLNGRVWVDSEPGKGATFYFTLP